MPIKNFYLQFTKIKDFSIVKVCNTHGDVITFVERYFSLEPLEAVYRLAEDFNIELPKKKEISNIEKKKIQKRIRLKRQEDMIYKDYTDTVNEVYNYLCRLYHIHKAKNGGECTCGYESA
jgi:DNA primase